MNITKEALLERGFKVDSGFWCYILKKDNVEEEIHVYCPPKGDLEVQLNSDEGLDLITVPHAKTLEDIDHLIRLFIG